MATLERVDSLHIDKTLYPREAVDRRHVLALQSALEAGATFPPIVVRRSTRHVVDGVHRLLATHAHRGAEAKIAVEWRDYDDLADLFLDGIKRNAQHGRRFDAADMDRCWHQAERLQVAPGMLARAFSVTVDRLRELSMRPAASAPMAMTAPPTPEPAGPPIPIVRRGPRQTTTPTEARTRLANQAASQLISLVNGGHINWADSGLVERLQRLQALLTAGLLSHDLEVA